MSERPRLLDLYCGAGGAARGYMLAGFDVTGVDNRPQPRYAGHRFIQADALDYLAKHGREYETIHASPPCKVHSPLAALRQVQAVGHVSLIAPTRDLLRATGKPYIIENVPGAPLDNPVVLCGSAVGLPLLRRHRLFESSIYLWATRCRHDLFTADLEPNRSDLRRRPGRRARVVVVAGHDSRSGNGGVAVWRQAMGIDWMTRDELAQAIPPAFTYYLGLQLRRYLEPEP